MLPPSKSEYDQDENVQDDLQAQIRASQGDGVVEPKDDETVSDDEVLDLDGDADAELDTDEDAEEEKPQKKKSSKALLFGGLGLGALVLVFGGAYVYQEHMQAPKPVARKVAVDPSLLNPTPAALPTEPNAAASGAVSAPTNPPASAPSSTPELAPNVLVPSVNSPAVANPSSVSTITAPPSDPFATGTTATPAPVATPAPGVAPTPTPTPAPVAAPVQQPSIAITPVPGAEPKTDPFGAVVTEQPKAETVIKTEKPVRAVKPKVTSADNGGEKTKPRATQQVRVKKPAVVREDRTTSEKHPSQERAQPQSSESFHGYEKLF